MTGETLVEAARSALSASMASDDRIVVLGEDVRAGGPFGLTKGLVDGFAAARVRDTPISESSVMGVGVGLALGGAHPLIEVMFDDFLTIASDQLLNHAAKIHFMSGGRHSVPLTVWSVAGAGTRWGAQHSQHLEGWFAQFPGLKMLAPSTPAMAATSLTAALADPDPVLVLVDRALLYSREALATDGSSPWTSRLVGSGGDLTIAATGRLVHLALDAAAEMGVRADVVDLQRLAPLDAGLLCESVRRTGRLVVLSDEVANGAFGALVVRAVYEQAYWYLDGPIVSVSSAPTPVPAGPELEDAYMVDAQQIRDAIRAALDA